MLAGTIHSHQLDKIRFPVLCSPKIDGIRCLIHPELGPVTRSFKPLPNAFVRDTLSRLVFTPLDGELVAVDDKGRVLEFNDTQSRLMTRGGNPKFRYLVFDDFLCPEFPFERRLNNAHCAVEVINQPFVIEGVNHVKIHTVTELQDYIEGCVQAGYEGTMIRAMDGPYKSGRSTLTQGWLLKYKEWCDAEGTIVGFEELMQNANEDIKDNFGLAKRTSHKANLVPRGTLGALVLNTEWGELRVGSGFDLALRDQIWQRNMTEATLNGNATAPDLGRKVTFKYQPFGMKGEGGKPRFPIFMRFREDE